MNRLKLLILGFVLALSIPLAYFAWSAYRGLEQEEFAQLRFFAETLFNEMEQELASLVKREENRAIDEYNYTYALSGKGGAEAVQMASPLSETPKEPYILGYFQNNPDGSFQTPLVPPEGNIPDSLGQVAGNLEMVNEIFNGKRTAALAEPVAPEPPVYEQKETAQSANFEDKFLDFRQSRRQKSHLGTEKKRIEAITPSQAVNLAQNEEVRYWAKSNQKKAKDQAAPPSSSTAQATAERETRTAFGQEIAGEGHSMDGDVSESLDFTGSSAPRLEAEVDPMQSVFIDGRYVFVFRRIALDNQMYRQGFVLEIDRFLEHLVETHFVRQPMASFASLALNVGTRARQVSSKLAGVPVEKPGFRVERRFPRPFSFLQAALTCEHIPESQGRQTLNIMIACLGFVVLAGLFAIYRSAQAVMDLSERRSRFVSSVTHELKTPLTNIRMYVEMLEQGMARTPEREQEYYKVLHSESARLSRLINNVLDFSKLEQKTFRIEPVIGTFEEVVAELKRVMGEKLKQEGFVLKVVHEATPPFEYDREVMLQVLINLMENSVKFGKNGSVREITLRIFQDGKWVKICVDDTGPGIPRHALKKVFDDFYRVDDSLTRTTRGTGIGLAFVKKAATALGGKARANNVPSGCAISIALPLKAADCS